MGLYDRDYGRRERTPWDRIENPRSMTITLIIICAVVFFLDMLITRRTDAGRINLLTQWGATNADTLTRPWMWWQFLTYGFLHSTHDIFHLLFNMVGLFFFGRFIEQRLGQMEFLRFFLVAIVIGGIVAGIEFLVRGGGSVVGASGGVVAITILFACIAPDETVLLMFVFPMKARVLAILFVAMDIAGAFGIIGSRGEGAMTAYGVHLAGAAFGALYYFQKWNLRWLAPASLGDLPNRLRHRSRKIKLKIHDPDKKLEQEADEADRILAKIHASGEESLTSSERKLLERYSRRQREKRNP